MFVCVPCLCNCALRGEEENQGKEILTHTKQNSCDIVTVGLAAASVWLMSRSTSLQGSDHFLIFLCAAVGH